MQMTTSTHEDQPRRGRPRNDMREESQPRRRKSATSGELTGQRLGVPKSILDHDRFAYRWINDDTGSARIYAKTKEDDWDIVANDGELCDSADLGNAVSKIVGTAPDGSALRAYLCRKPRGFFDEDQKAKSAELDRQMAELRRGNTRSGEAQADYIPASGIRMG
jgi:hypothetical protein